MGRLFDYQKSKNPGAAQEQQNAPKMPKKPESSRMPEHSIATSEDQTSLILSVEVPTLQSMEGVGLDVAEKSASLVFPLATSIGTLKTPLPEAVVPTKAKAKF